MLAGLSGLNIFVTPPALCAMPVRRRRLPSTAAATATARRLRFITVFLARQFDPHRLMPDPFADLYSSSHKSSKRQPLYWLLTMIVSPFSLGCQQVAARKW